MTDQPASRTRGAKRRRDDTESLRQDYECPVCRELPAGAVHRCAKGHRICGACDERLETRRCPECRVALPPGGDPWKPDLDAPIADLDVPDGSALFFAEPN